MADIDLKCKCGEVTGVATHITPRSGNRVVCCCSDCQAFAQFLGTEADTLDDAGGTELYQTSQSQVKIHTGHENLRSMRLTRTGLLRWYTSCCNTPVGNSMKASIPFFGIIHTFMDIKDKDKTLGDVRAYCQTQSATGQVDHPKAHPKFPLPIYFRIGRQLIFWKLQGKHKPSDFFDETGRPVAKPLIAKPLVANS